MTRIAIAALAAVVLAAMLPIPAAAGSRWGQGPYPDPPGFCPAQSWLPSTYRSIATNDPEVSSNPEQDTFFGYHAKPGYDDWYGYWYGDLNGNPGTDTGWRWLFYIPYGSTGHWNFSTFGWHVEGHVRQYIAYYNWTFAGQCGMGRHSTAPPPYMADVDGYPVIDFWVDAAPPDQPRPRVVETAPAAVTFTWDPVNDEGSGAAQDYFAVGLDHYTSWLTIAGGVPQQQSDSPAPLTITARGLAPGVTACVHVVAVDKLGNRSPEGGACGGSAAPPPAPPPPSAGSIAVNPHPLGLAGLDAWLWLTPAPTAVTYVEAAGGLTYRVVSTPATVAWSFGDGSPALVGGSGRAYPEASDVRHVYEAVSAAGYRVTAVVTWTRSWYVADGAGGWVGPYAMAPVTSAATPLTYPVEQAQPELAAG